jgi:enamine deaminase RidA (YjgF/YER057c/UK114 family)
VSKKLVNPGQLYDGAAFGLSHAVIDPDSSLIFVSGQVDWDKQSQVIHSTMESQLEAALDNLRVVLSTAGSSVENLLQLRIYIRGELEEHLEAIAPIVSSFLAGTRVAMTGIGVASLASKATLVEVEAVAKAS